MSSTTPQDYSKLKVPELRDALLARKLSATGMRNDLVERLIADDAATAASPSPAASTPNKKASAHLPSAEEYEVDWDHDEPAKPSAPTPAPAPAPATAAEKPKRRTIASLFDTPAPATTKAGNEPSSPSTVTDETSAPPVAPTSAPALAAAAPTFSANLPTTSLDDEIARRKKRAERFGMSAEESDALKTLERQKRFGVVTDTAAKKDEVRGLDEALPERERKRRGDGQGQAQGRGGKRGRFNDREPPQQQQQQQRRRGGRAGVRNGGGVESGRVHKAAPAVALDPEDRRKAEERRKRFAT